MSPLFSFLVHGKGHDKWTWADCYRIIQPEGKTYARPEVSHFSSPLYSQLLVGASEMTTIDKFSRQQEELLYLNQNPMIMSGPGTTFPWDCQQSIPMGMHGTMMSMPRSKFSRVYVLESYLKLALYNERTYKNDNDPQEITPEYKKFLKKHNFA
jgi:hypothetical protein